MEECGVGTALAWPSGSSLSISSMANPVDASPTGDLLVKGWGGEGCGEGVMGGGAQMLQGLLGALKLGGALKGSLGLILTPAHRPCQWVGSAPEKADHVQQRAAAGAGAGVRSTALP